MLSQSNIRSGSRTFTDGSAKAPQRASVQNLRPLKLVPRLGPDIASVLSGLDPSMWDSVGSNTVKALQAQLGSDDVAAVLQPLADMVVSHHVPALAVEQAAASVQASLPVLEPHFGTATLQTSADAVVDWVGGLTTELAGAVPSGAEGHEVQAALGQVQSTLVSLSQAAQLLASSPQGTLGQGTTAAATAMASLVASLQHPAAASSSSLAALLPADAAASLAGAGAGAGEVVDAVLSALGAQLQALGGAGALAGAPGSASDLASASLTVAAALSVVAVSLAPTTTTTPPQCGPTDHLSYEYTPEALEAYFARRPVAVMRRAAEVAVEAAAFGLALASDIAAGRVAENEALRAEQLRGAIERLGPAYVKVAQALSTRVDLLPPAYFVQIQMLQDRVKTVPCDVARQVMAATLARPPESLFEAISDKPVAAASLGQVYRARLRPELGGGEVAVKVQRPGVLEAVALDLLLMRKAGLALSNHNDTNTTNVASTNWAAVIDAWAVRFLHEMDYRREADNAARFERDMAGLKGICVPRMLPDLSSDAVLTTDWVQGEKLQESAAPDVLALCTTLLNAYLLQLLDTGFLHADPHPGNLIRTPEGRICVLDFGLMTEVSDAQRWGLVEFIAHLITEDWEALAHDLQTLGFIPREIDPAEVGLVAPLGRIMSQLVGGGGVAKVNLDKVMDELDELGRLYPFQIPPFFALILRAFSVIEGIALGVDPDYAIVQQCTPYIARRLLSDNSPRARALLRDVLYGGRQRLDIARLQRLADAFAAFSTDGLTKVGGSLVNGSGGGRGVSQTLLSPVSSMGDGSRMASGAGAGPSGRSSLFPPPISGVNPGFATAADASSTALTRTAASPAFAPSRASGSSGFGDESGAVDPAVREALLVVFSARGSYLQEVLVEEAVAAVDALSREAVSALLGAALGSAPAMMARGALDALGPLRGVVLPVPTPVEVLSRLAPAVAVTAEDREALLVVRGILSLISQAMAAAAVSQQASAGARTRSGVASSRNSSGDTSPVLAATSIGPLLPELLPGLVHTGDLFVRALLKRASYRLSNLSLVGLLTAPSSSMPAYSPSATGARPLAAPVTSVPSASLPFTSFAPPASSGATPAARTAAPTVANGRYSPTAPPGRQATAPGPSGQRPPPKQAPVQMGKAGSSPASVKLGAPAPATNGKVTVKGVEGGAQWLLGGGARIASTANSQWVPPSDKGQL